MRKCRGFSFDVTDVNQRDVHQLFGYSTYIASKQRKQQMTVYTTSKGFGKVVSTRGVYKVYRLEKGVWKLLSKFTTTDRATAEYDCRLCAQ